MKHGLLVLLSVLIGSIGGLGVGMGVANAQVPPQPDCILFISLSSAASTGVFDNRFIGCDTWTLSYQSSGFTGLTIAFQSATGATTAGAFGTYTGTVVTGINPNTNTTGRITQFSNGLVITPWLRVNLSGLTGTGSVNGVVYGYKTGYTSGSGGGTGAPCPGTAATPCVVDGPDAPGAAPTQNPVLFAGFDATNVRRVITDTTGRLINDPLGAATAQADGATNTANVPFVNGAQAYFPMLLNLFNGTTWDRSQVCTLTKIVDDSTSGTVQQIALSGSTKVRICKMTLTGAASVDVQLIYGTGSNCGTGTNNLSGLYQQVLTVAEDYLADQSTLTTPAGQAVCLSLGAAIRVTGTISYAQYN